jgi:NAD(P)-dependent dehydrogenase (short-subunit alcohol dehydrogenase family)
MELGLKGRTALITGGNKGIGRGVAEEFAREGVDLHLAARSKPELEEVQRELTSKYGVKVEIYPRDLSKRDVRDRLARDCAHVDILVNCAGAVPGGDLDQVTEDAWRAGWDLKLFGFVGITRIVYKEMCRRKRGVIVNVVGVGGISTSANYICGGPNNAALIHFTVSLGGASVRHNVRVCGVNPGPIDTQRMRDLAAVAEQKVPPHKLEEHRRNASRNFAYGRAGRVDEVTGAVAFLASDRASYISGAMLTIDGGLIARGYGAPGTLIEEEEAV